MAVVIPTVALNNGYNMPIIGLGTFMASSNVVGEVVNAALEAGYRHLDTSNSYDQAVAIGKVLTKWMDSGKIKREELFIVTKLPGSGNRAESVEKYLKKSLEGFQLSYVDLYLVHSAMGSIEQQEGSPRGPSIPDMTTDHVSIWKAMEAQVDAGRARSIGLSNFNSRQIKRIVKEARIPPANLQIELNVYFQQRELAAFCNALDITVCAYAPLGSPAFPEFLKKMGRDLTGMPEHSPLTDPVVLAVAAKHDKTAAQVLLRHITQRGIIAIPKTSNLERLKTNIQVFDFQLDKEDAEKLYSLDKRSKGRLFGATLLKDTLNHPEYPFNDPY